MANRKITALGSLTTLADNDVVAVVDVSDSSMAASGTTKKSTAANVRTYMQTVTGDIDITAGVATLENIPSAAVTAAGLAGRFPYSAEARWFGAVGDGATDDTAAIQAACDSLPLNTADTGVLSPKGFADGGTIFLRAGRYVVSDEIVLQRGTRIVGEGRESTQIISRTTGNVFSYPDAGRYIQDEIVFENLSIWQAADVTATTGAAINVGFGPASVQSTKVIIRNVYVEGTYEGYHLDAGVASVFEAADASKCVSHGFAIRYTDGSNSVTTTSTRYSSCYASLNGGDGFHIMRGSYCSWNATASDSNTGYGYYFEGGQGHEIQGGAEGNTAGGIQLKDTAGITLSPVIVQTTGTMHGITLDNAINTTLLGGSLSSGGTGYAISRSTARRLVIIGTEFLSSWATNRVTGSTSHMLMLADANGLVGQTNRWGIGVTADPDATSTLVVGGLADAVTNAILKVNGTHTEPVGARNVAVYAQVITANTAKTYPDAAGVYIPNTSKGAASTVTRTAGIYLAEQTVGTNNTDIFIDAGAGATPAGNWAIVSGSTRASILSGPLRMGGSTGPLWTSGAGTPEGAVTAPIGSLFSRTDGGAGTSFYVKESGAGNTGWVAK